MKVYFFGAGVFAKELLTQIKELPEWIDVLGFVDNDPARWGVFMDKQCFPPRVLSETEYDEVIILPDMYYDVIRDNLIYWYGINEKKIKDRNYLLKLLMTDKYRDSGDTEIQAILRHWEAEDISVYNQYIKEDTDYSEVYWDHMENMPYIMFEDKRMYYPFDTKFREVDGKKVVEGILGEQQQTSPHLYIRDDITVEKGDVVVDAGVCEGNFILRYIENVSKAYLFECDKRWKRPLELSLSKFSDKVVLCDKFLGSCTGRDTVRLDDVIDGRVDFIKMDIEGAEPEALLGGRNVLQNNHAKCALCSYHRSGDERAIRDILHQYGYSTSTSEGYMVYLYDRDIWSSVDFRRGIVYGRKK